MHTTLVSTDLLGRNLGNRDWVVADVRASLADADYGHRSYVEGHIPGAVHTDLNRDLSDLTRTGRGRHPLPAIEAFALKAGSWGISTGTQVVAYDDADGMYASRLWWMLRWAGHDAVAVLDGGLGKWIAEGRALATGEERRAPCHFVMRPREARAVTADEVERLRSDPGHVVVDSRSPDRYRGENETIDAVAGHIPGARNYFFKNNMAADGTFRPPDELRSQLEEQLAGRASGSSVFYCGSGVTACHNLLAMEIAGLTGARLFPGSWSEWISNPDRPIATGDETD